MAKSWGRQVQAVLNNILWWESLSPLVRDVLRDLARESSAGERQRMDAEIETRLSELEAWRAEVTRVEDRYLAEIFGPSGPPSPTPREGA